MTSDATISLGDRWQAALRRRYPLHTAKSIAHDFGVEVRTATAWLAGAAPYAKYLTKAWELHGPAIIWEVLCPVGMEKPADVVLGDVETRLENMQSHLNMLSSDVSYLRNGRGA